MACLQFLLFWSITINFLCVYGNDDAVGGLTLINVLTTFKEMQAKLDKLETSERDLKQTVSILVGKTEQLRVHVDRLETSEAKLKQTVKTLSKTTAKLQQHIAKLTKTEAVSEHPKKEDTLKTQPEEFLANTSNSVEETTRTFTKKRQILNDCRKRDNRQTSEQVAFSAYLDHVIRNLGLDQIIVYNRLLLNEAGAYSTYTGVFRVPVSGFYLFSWSVTARKLQGEHGYDIWVKLVVNGQLQLSTAAESQVDTDDNQSSNTAVLHVKQGDEVWTSNYGSPDIFGSDNERTTSFTGVLLHAD